MLLGAIAAAVMPGNFFFGDFFAARHAAGTISYGIWESCSSGEQFVVSVCLLLGLLGLTSFSTHLARKGFNVAASCFFGILLG